MAAPLDARLTEEARRFFAEKWGTPDWLPFRLILRSMLPDPMAAYFLNEMRKWESRFQ